MSRQTDAPVYNVNYVHVLTELEATSAFSSWKNAKEVKAGSLVFERKTVSSGPTLRASDVGGDYNECVM